MECAFCPQTAKLSAEHLWSRWIRDLFPAKKFIFIQRNQAGKALKTWYSPKIDLTTKVVCKRCNESWMSAIENEHAKPAMSDLILGNKVLTVSQSRANSIALFAFKTAVIVDHMRRKETFFPRSVRHDFARSLTIPPDVQMWLAGFLPGASGRFNSSYSDLSIDARSHLELYVCTYAVGHFVFQVVAARHAGIPSFSPRAGFEHLGIPFWPTIPEGVAWPPPNVLRTWIEFEQFSERWGAIQFV